ncbi:hypothetical protein [Streptomyces sp. NPDC048496]|uniref:hypothetical protein n=1 Tax=Streptomyces sp. NPDC048496 TaxID=3365558 RepID=UPI00371DF9DA
MRGNLARFRARGLRCAAELDEPARSFLAAGEVRSWRLEEVVGLGAQRDRPAP